MKLPARFYRRSTTDVAVDLLGKVLVRRLDGGLLSGMIVETEAYVGPEDLACHASKGRTARTEVMFGPPGRAYVYLIYGMYHCLNAVTGPRGHPAAVLIRAIEPLEGQELMRRHRGRVKRDIDLCSGPGKLCQALAIDRALNRSSLSGRSLWVEDRSLDPGPIARSPRIGVDYAGEYRAAPWRYFAVDNPHVSRHRFNRSAEVTLEALEPA